MRKYTPFNKVYFISLRLKFSIIFICFIIIPLGIAGSALIK